MHRELVERRGWIDQRRFLEALNVCMLLPGPEAHQLSVYVGWLLHRTRGALVAGTLFLLPGAMVLWALSWLYVAHGETPAVAAVFAGLRPAVVALVAAALWRVGRTAIRSPGHGLLAVTAFLALTLGRLPFPVVIAAAALIGACLGRRISGRRTDDPLTAPQNLSGPAAPASATSGRGYLSSAWATVGTAASWITLWLAPLVALSWSLGPEHVLTTQARFFSHVALVTFGGAYAVLPYVAHHAVEVQGWVTSGQMLDGLGLAETTPGPLVLVLQFVGFLGAWGNPAPFSPLVAATLGSAVTLWSTFVPSFLFILTLAPHMERLNRRRWVSDALAAVTAAVVGVILSLAVWFGREVGWPQGRLDVWAIALSVLAWLALTRTRIGLLPVLLTCGLAGWLRHVLGI